MGRRFINRIRQAAVFASLCILWTLLPAILVSAQSDLVELSDERLRPRYEQLTQEIRCPKCQNQNLAESNSPISVDLKLQIRRLLEEQKSNQQIKDYLTERYSEFILYRPAVNSRTWLLWAAPVIFMSIALLALWVVQRKKAPILGANNLSSPPQKLDDEEVARLERLLKGSDELQL